MDTGAVRYVTGGAVNSSVSFGFSESWWVKVILELGVTGTLLFILCFGWLLLRGFRAHQTISEERLRAVSASLLAMVVWTLTYLLKGPQIDLDPVNVYFWLFAGLLVGLPAVVLQPSEIRGQLAPLPRVVGISVAQRPEMGATPVVAAGSIQTETPG
jgi:hypothetical protein